MGWHTDEPNWAEAEYPSLFEQLVFRAVTEEEISIQKGAELLKKPSQYVLKDVIKTVVEKFYDYTADGIVAYMHEEQAYIQTQPNELISFVLAAEIRDLQGCEKHI